MAELAWHKISEHRHSSTGLPKVWKTEVMQGGEVDWDDELEEAVFTGGRKVATLYRRSYGEAVEAGIRYSRVCA